MTLSPLLRALSSWCVALCVSLLCINAANAWSFVRSTGNNSATTGSSFSTTITAVTSGDIVTFGVLAVGATIASLSATDNQGNGYSQVGAGNVAGSTAFIDFMSNGPITNAPTSITINSTGSWTNIVIRIDEWTPTGGMATFAADGNHYTNGFEASATLFTDTAFTTTVNGDLVISYASSNTSTANTGAGWTATSGATGFNVSEYQVQSSAGSIAGSWTLTGSFQMGTFAIKGTAGSTAKAADNMSLLGVQ